ncbi:hypothetical protein J7E29_09500 [Streptomyces sp. ISL-90]|nr:hypothetical protein [Streptomyces sp. ISL-90]
MVRWRYGASSTPATVDHSHKNETGIVATAANIQTVRRRRAFSELVLQVPR